MWYLFHPALVHFPIALLLVYVGLTLVYLRRPDAFLERSAYGALVLGWWGALAALLSGLLAAAVQWPYESTTLLWINLHAVASFALLFVAGRALLMRKRNPHILQSQERRTYLALVVLTGILVLAGGFLGGHLVYGLDVR